MVAILVRAVNAHHGSERQHNMHGRRACMMTCNHMRRTPCMRTNAPQHHLALGQVLDRGHVAQFGSHAELLETGGLYAAMWARQKDSSASTLDLTSLAGQAPGPSTSSPASATHPSVAAGSSMGGAGRGAGGGGAGGGGGAAAGTAAAVRASLEAAASAGLSPGSDVRHRLSPPSSAAVSPGPDQQDMGPFAAASPVLAGELLTEDDAAGAHEGPRKGQGMGAAGQLSFEAEVEGEGDGEEGGRGVGLRGMPPGLLHGVASVSHLRSAPSGPLPARLAGKGEGRGWGELAGRQGGASAGAREEEEGSSEPGEEGSAATSPGAFAGDYIPPGFVGRGEGAGGSEGEHRHAVHSLAGGPLTRLRGTTSTGGGLPGAIHRSGGPHVVLDVQVRGRRDKGGGVSGGAVAWG